jgi:nucleoside-diphosphate-sugar epimerase
MCSGYALPDRDLYDAVAEALGGSMGPGRVESPAADGRRQADGTRPVAGAERLLDWAPFTPLNDRRPCAVDWYREHGVDETYTHLALKG